jgi:acyl carrier protein
MKDIDILNVVKKIFADNFQMNPDDIQSNMGMNDIAQWGSLTHIFLIDKIESEFNIEFTPNDIEKAININQIINIINNKLK